MNEFGRTIVTTIRELDSPSPKVREHALAKLEEIGAPAGWHLIQALHPVGPTARQEVLRALRDLADPDAADTFVERLEDEDSVCRWLAAEGLVALGAVGLERALDLLTVYPPNEHVLRGTHHVLTGLEKQGHAETVRPVLAAYGSTHPQVDLPAAAHRARTRLGTTTRSPVG